MMRGSRLIEAGWPRIAGTGYERHSPQTQSYNCIAYAAGDMFRWWGPYDFWPNAAPGLMLADLIAAYESVGFVNCGVERAQEEGFEKIALYQNPMGEWTHAARLRPDGWWESKVGGYEDILHRTPEAMENRLYGTVIVCMKRTRADGLRARIEARRWARQNRKW